MLFYWLYFNCSTWVLLTRSSIDLLIFPSSFFEGFFIKRQVGLLVKLSLWSFSVVNDSALGRCSILYAKLIFFAIFLASRLIDISNFVGAFFYVYVILFLISFSWCLGYILYMLLVLSAKMNILFDFLIFSISDFSFFWKLSLTLLNFIDLTILNTSFSNSSNSARCGEWCRDLKYIYLYIW